MIATSLNEFYFRWLENEVIDIRKPEYIPSNFNYLKWKRVFRLQIHEILHIKSPTWIKLWRGNIYAEIKI